MSFSADHILTADFAVTHLPGCISHLLEVQHEHQQKFETLGHLPLFESEHCGHCEADWNRLDGGVDWLGRWRAMLKNDEVVKLVMPPFHLPPRSRAAALTVFLTRDPRTAEDVAVGAGYQPGTPRSVAPMSVRLKMTLHLPKKDGGVEVVEKDTLTWLDHSRANGLQFRQVAWLGVAQWGDLAAESAPRATVTVTPEPPETLHFRGLEMGGGALQLRQASIDWQRCGDAGEENWRHLWSAMVGGENKLSLALPPILLATGGPAVGLTVRRRGDFLFVAGGFLEATTQPTVKPVRVLLDLDLATTRLDGKAELFTLERYPLTLGHFSEHGDIKTFVPFPDKTAPWKRWAKSPAPAATVRLTVVD